MKVAAATGSYPVKARLTAPPEPATLPTGLFPTEGEQRFIVAPGATGDWTGQDEMVAQWIGFAAGPEWRFHRSPAGRILYVIDEDAYYSTDGETWTLEPDAGTAGEAGEARAP